MDESTAKIIKAHNVIVNAFAYFDESSRISQKAAKLKKDKGKSFSTKYLMLGGGLFLAANLILTLLPMLMLSISEKKILIFVFSLAIFILLTAVLILASVRILRKYKKEKKNWTSNTREY